MEKKFYPQVYFIGIGGIGMSALARYFKAKGCRVSGYDLTPSALTDTLQAEGIEIHFTDLGDALAQAGYSPKDTLVVYTPAVPTTLGELQYFRRNHFDVVKRSEALGTAVAHDKLLAVAGTHGKTTTSSLLSHLLYSSHIGTQAFLGGITVNYQSNLLLHPTSPYVVVEADEYDRSFLHLYPEMAVVTAMDPDHLDVYGTPEGYRQGFAQFIQQIQSGGVLVYKKGCMAHAPLVQDGVRCYSYATEQEADSYADAITIEKGRLYFDWHFPLEGIHWTRLELGVPIAINVENATAALTLAYLAGATEEELREALASFKGIRRRFERIVDLPAVTLIDDYAHHPEELRAAISSVRRLYPNEPLTGIFQPHLYSRTHDFFHEFALVLSTLDEVILLPIYPAREEPIPGVTSELILEHVTAPHKALVAKEDLIAYLQQKAHLNRVILTLGAGNIDRLVQPLGTMLQQRYAQT